jgi:hypothetical protein
MNWGGVTEDQIDDVGEYNQKFINKYFGHLAWEE